MRRRPTSRHARVTYAINRQRMILALHVAAHGDGPIVTASDAELGRLAGGLSPATVRRHLEDLVDDSEIQVFNPAWCEAKRRILVIADHPDADDVAIALSQALDVPWELPWDLRRAREEAKLAH